MGRCRLAISRVQNLSISLWLSMPCSTTTNSSPPSLATMSWSRVHSRKRAPTSCNTASPGSDLGDEQSTTPPRRPANDSIEGEQAQALEQWLRKIPDDPGELLRRKFWYEQQQHQ